MYTLPLNVAVAGPLEGGGRTRVGRALSQAVVIRLQHYTRLAFNPSGRPIPPRLSEEIGATAFNLHWLTLPVGGGPIAQAAIDSGDNQA